MTSKKQVVNNLKTLYAIRRSAGNLGRDSAFNGLSAPRHFLFFTGQCFYLFKVIGSYWPTTFFIVANGPGGEPQNDAQSLLG